MAPSPGPDRSMGWTMKRFDKSQFTLAIIRYHAFQVLLRGAVLRNTPWCYGLVLFAGKDTKLMQNSGKTKFKRTSIDKLLNFIILGIVIFLLSMCLFCTVACGFWESMIGFNFKVDCYK